jgi:hypothetical protein
VSRLPNGYRTLRLSVEVRQSFNEHLVFSLLGIGNGGVLYGRISPRRELVVEYVAPFFLDMQLSENSGRGYALGRAEALFEAVWQLRGLRPIGYWLTYDGEFPALDLVLEHLEIYSKLDLEIEELALLVAAQPQAGQTEMAAYTYAARQPVSALRALTCR